MIIFCCLIYLKVVTSQPPGDKEGFTIALMIGADGRKFPAVIVFRSGIKKEKLSESILSKLVAPENVKIESAPNAWWNKALDASWIKDNFEMSGEKKVLIRDHFAVHKCLDRLALIY